LKFNKREAILLLFAGLILFGGFACQSNDRYIGIYESMDSGEGAQKKNVIELLGNGEGVWHCCEGEVKFIWYVKNDDLRIHTKEGGIMVGELRDDAFTITLPGKKKLTFTRVVFQE